MEIENYYNCAKCQKRFSDRKTSNYTEKYDGRVCDKCYNEIMNYMAGELRIISCAIEYGPDLFSRIYNCDLNEHYREGWEHKDWFTYMVCYMNYYIHWSQSKEFFKIEIKLE
jgi:DNA-directed RNA polymerase subunit RPC12/RpoP